MNGKTLKVVEYNLTFGGTDRFVNVFGFFKYKKTRNIISSINHIWQPVWDLNP